ncbi:MAG: TonB-dependent receptor [Pseudomonadota bacterium]
MRVQKTELSGSMIPFAVRPALTATALAMALSVTHPGVALAQGGSTDFTVPAGPLNTALIEFGAESGVQFVYDSEIAAGRISGGVSGTLSAEEALVEVLDGTGLTYRFTSADTVTIQPLAVPGGGAAGVDQGTMLLDPIIVTARRTEEALQNVPSSVFVLDGEEIDRSNITDTDDLSLLTPNFDFSGGDNPGRIFFAIRGISDLNGASTGPTLGFFQDGILQNNSALTINSNRGLVDVDRVEVVYGPQGTAFGRGTIGGAINVVTNKPTDTFEASLRTELGSLPDGSFEAVINVPLSDQVAVRAVAYGELSDGFVDLPFGDTEDSIGATNAGSRLSARFTPTDRLTVDASVQYDTTSVDAPTFAVESSVLDSDPASLNGTIDELDIERLNLRGEVAYEFESGTLRATSAYNFTNFEGGEDFDFTPPDNSFIVRDSFERVFSQELRFESAEFSMLDGLGKISTNLGFIYSDMERENNPFFETNFFGGPGGNQTINSLKITNIGVFGDVRWRPIDRLEITAGARFSRDKADFALDVAPTGTFTTFVEPLVFDDDRTYTAVTPNASITYAITDEVTTYFSFSTGYRPGGLVGTLVGAPIEFDEERVRNFEGGIRATFLDGRLSASGSGFALFYDDIQVPISQAFGGGIENAAEARSIGAEIQLGAQPIDGLALQANLGLAFAKFTDFEASIAGDQTGDRLPRAPRVSFSFIGDYEHPEPIVGQMRPFARAEYSIRSGFSGGVGGDDDLGGFDVTNLRAGLRGDDYEVTFFVENLFNEGYATENVVPAAVANAALPPGFEGERFLVPGPTRRFGVEALFRF